jgi:hypothetical protein
MGSLGKSRCAATWAAPAAAVQTRWSAAVLAPGRTARHFEVRTVRVLSRYSPPGFRDYREVTGIARHQENLARGADRALCGGRAAGCASGTPGTQSTVLPDRTMSAPASTAAAGDPQVLARQAYLGMWQAFTAASRTADYQYPSLDRYAAGAALELLTRGLYQNYQAGIVTRGEPTFDPP